MGILWEFQSIYELQFFKCPACDYTEKSKQKFIDHAWNVHPESATYLMNVSDIDDVVCPWNDIEIKEEIDTENENFEELELDTKIDRQKVKKSCQICGKSLLQVYMRTHMKLKHEYNEELDSHKCDLCGKVFKTKNGCTKHKQKDHEGKRYKCDSCDYTSKGSEGLKRHIRIVHEGKFYQCEQCGKQLTTEEGLQTHVKTIHENIRDIQCDICGKHFASKKRLSTHKVQTHGDKKHVCDSCGMRFRSKANLKTHEDVVHKGIKNFKCTYCGLSFPRDFTLRSHITSFHED